MSSAIGRLFRCLFTSCCSQGSELKAQRLTKVARRVIISFSPTLYLPNHLSNRWTSRWANCQARSFDQQRSRVVQQVAIATVAAGYSSERALNKFRWAAHLNQVHFLSQWAWYSVLDQFSSAGLFWVSRPASRYIASWSAWAMTSILHARASSAHYVDDDGYYFLLLLLPLFYILVPLALL